MNITTSLNRYLERKNAARLDRGLSLTETLLVLGVIAIIAVIAYGGYNYATGSVRVGGETQALIQFQAGITKVFSTDADYTGVTIANTIDAGLVPKAFKVKGTGATRTLVNAYGGTVTPASQTVPTANTSKFQIVYTAVPAEYCVELAQAVASAAQEVYVSASGTAATATGAVKTIANPNFATTTAITQCAGTGQKQITIIGS